MFLYKIMHFCVEPSSAGSCLNNLLVENGECRVIVPSSEDQSWTRAEDGKTGTVEHYQRLSDRSVSDIISDIGQAP